MGFDNRQIQTAVLGNADSDEPLVCPTGALELDVFREEYGGGSFWCGILLGGCGGQLMTKRYGDRVCHFSHLPDPEHLLPSCRRRDRSAGAASADHLYIKTATQAWLRKQGHAPKYRFTEHEDVPLGSLVDITAAGLNLRFHRDPTIPPDWGSDNAPELILGPGVRVDRATLLRRGYINRFTMRSQGSTRVMSFGTETPGAGTEWFSLNDCEVTPDGRLKTPAADRIWRTSQRPHAAAAADRPADPEGHGPVQIGELVRLLGAAVRTEQITAIRGLLRAADGEMARCEGLALHTLQDAVDRGRAWLDGQDKRRRITFTRLQEAVDTGRAGAAGALVDKANSEVRRSGPANDAEAALLESGQRLWDQWITTRNARSATSTTPSVRPTSWPKRPLANPNGKLAKRARQTARTEVATLLARLDAEARSMSPAQFAKVIQDLDRAATAAGQISTRQRRDIERWSSQKNPTAHITSTSLFSSPPQPTAPAPRTDQLARTAFDSSLPPDKLDSAAGAVRGALKKAARKRTTTSWARLRQQLGSALPRMTPGERIDVLVRVDRPTPADQPLLSALVAAGDPDIAAQYRRVAAALGRPAPTDDRELRSAVNREVRRLHDLWRYQ